MVKKYDKNSVIAVAAAVILTISLVFSLGTAAFLFASNATYSIWKNAYEVQEDIQSPPGGWNPSEKYILFAAYDIYGNKINDPVANESQIDHYSAIGYEATAIYPYVIIPSTHKTPTERVVPVSRISADYDTDEPWAGNPFIRTLLIPESVSIIEMMAFANMDTLYQVTILGASDLPSIIIEDYAFLSCPSLYTNMLLTPGGRPIYGDKDMYMLGCPEPD
ncbi:MAG: hypothetical protein LBT55_03020 [Clostridiaceae bacterium]|jgi:hypothetical protein|nr:hypothetical protein [Clostridiaceae bacterium]